MCIYINLVDIYESTSIVLAEAIEAIRYKWTPAHDMQGKKRIKNLYSLVLGKS